MNVVRTQASHLILYSQQPMVASDSFYKTELNPPTLGKDGWGGGGGGGQKHTCDRNIEIGNCLAFDGSGLLKISKCEIFFQCFIYTIVRKDLCFHPLETSVHMATSILYICLQLVSLSFNFLTSV